jgi:hypothetical protein
VRQLQMGHRARVLELLCVVQRARGQEVTMPEAPFA